MFDRYASPNKEHWLGTDTNGMDMLTRLMYGGRVSLIIGFIVVAIEGSIGIVMGETEFSPLCFDFFTECHL